MERANNKLFHKGTEEYYNAIRTNIQFSGKNVKTIAITSTRDGEGKSTVAMNIATSLANIGKKVVLVDADTRNSVFIGRMHITAKVKGLTDYLSGNAAFEQVLINTSMPNLHMVLSGPVPPNPTALLQNELFNQLLVNCREVYDYVIVDTPPLGLVTDASIIAHQCDGSILVVETDKIKRSAVRKIHNQLVHTGAEFLGVVLNKVNMKKGSYGGYGNYGEYGKK